MATINYTFMLALRKTMHSCLRLAQNYELKKGCYPSRAATFSKKLLWKQSCVLNNIRIREQSRTPGYLT